MKVYAAAIISLLAPAAALNLPGRWTCHAAPATAQVLTHNPPAMRKPNRRLQIITLLVPLSREHATATTTSALSHLAP